MAQLKNTTISDTANLTLPLGTTAQRPANPQAGMIRFNTSINDTEYYDGSVWRPISDTNVEATGGTIVDTDIGGIPYRIHMFTTTGNSTFTVTKGGEVDYLIVAGGGSGGFDNAGGGGAGGLLTGTTTVTPQAYTITVGAGGINDQLYNYRGPAGSNSSAFGLTAIGGGGGGGGDNGGSQSGTNFANSQLRGGDGGSGGGGASEGGNGAGGLSIEGQGNSGGAGLLGSGGGGGGAGSAGTNATANNSPGNGGHGIISLITGTPTFYSGGGGGGTENSVSVVNGTGVAGLGGGGFGGALNRARTRGLPNTGGGGGGEANGNPAGNGSGGSGVVIVRYRRNASTTTSSTRRISSSQPAFYGLVNKIGLVLELDANNPTSYQGTESTWVDISGQGNNFSINPLAFKTERGISYMDFKGSAGCAKYATGGDLVISGNVTLICWTRVLNNNANWRTLIRGTNIAGGGSGSDHHIIIQSGGWEIGMYDNTNGTAFQGSGFSQQSLPSYGSNQWNMLVWRWNNAATPYYNFYYNDTPNVLRGSSSNINSRFKHGFNSLGAYGNDVGTNVNSASQYWGDISSFYLYNRFLSNIEVSNIFNTTRQRYGI